MTTVHERLYRADDLSKIEFTDYAKILTSDLERVFHDRHPNVSLSLTGEPFVFTIDLALPMAMILSELVTNAYKHAFVGDAQGRIAVAFHRRGDGVEMTVGDDGIGLPDDHNPETVSSFGWRLVTTLCDQIGARMDVGDGPGTQVTVYLPEIREQA